MSSVSMMGLTKVGWFIILATLSSTQAFNTVTPWGKEVVYSWRALVKAGTHFPAPFASLFDLNGKIHVQSNENTTHVKITDLTYKLYNGKLDHVQENAAHTIPALEEVQDLENVFKIVHGTHGEVVGIATEEQEQEFSRNIKRAIATILQINDTILENPHHQAFVTKEDSIFGYSEVDYIVIPHGAGEIEVHKLHEMRDSSYLYRYLVNTIENGHCDAPFEEVLMHDSKKKYIITKQDGHHVVKSIVSHGAIYYYPFKAQSDSQFITVNQTFQLIEAVPIQEQFLVKSEHLEHQLNYHRAVERDGEPVPDVTNGRQFVDYTKLTRTVQQLIREVPKYLQEDHVNTKEPDVKQVDLINRIHRILKYFTVEELEELSKTFSGEELDVFYRMIPLVGSKASTLYVKHLVVNKLVSDELAVELLQQFAEHITMPTLEQLTELEDLIHLNESVAWAVRRVAILSFATIIRNSYTHYLRVNPTNDVDVQQPYEKYIVEYINKIKNSHDYQIQLTYTLAFVNMRLPSAIKHLHPIVRGDLGQDLRFPAIWAVGHTIVLEANPDTVMETLWLIFTNREDPIEVRVAAYLYIMESRPSHTRLKNIFWYMLTEPDEEFYHLHYSYVKTMVQSKDPCKRTTGVKLAQLLKFMHPPRRGVSLIHRNDYHDANYGFGSGVEYLLIKTKNGLLFSSLITEQMFHKYRHNSLFFVRVREHSSIMPSIEVEIGLFKHGNVIDTYCINLSNMLDFHPLSDFIFRDRYTFDKTLLSIGYDKFLKGIIPTDLGIPAVWEFLQPEVYQHQFHIVKNTTNEVTHVHVRNRHVAWIHYKHGLSFYNPFADVWQGISRRHSFDSVLPLNLAILFDNRKQSLQISCMKQDNHQMNVAGFRSHVEQVVFVQDDFQKHVLIQSSPNSKEWQVVSNGDQYRNDYTIIDHDDVDTGHKWYMGVYDSEKHVSNGSFNHIVLQIMQPHTKSFNSPVAHFWLSLMNWRQDLILLPRPGSHGLVLRVEPSRKHLVTSINLSLRVVKDENTIVSKYPYTRGKKWNTQFTYDVKNKEESLKSWNVNAILDMNPGHTVNNFKLHLTRSVPGLQDFNVCVDGVKKWNQTRVTGHLNVATSQSPDGKCAKRDTVLEVAMTGQRSYEQDHEHHVYGACDYVVPYSIPHYHTLECLASHTSLRHYVYDVRTMNLPTEFRTVSAQWWDLLKSHYHTYFTHQDEDSKNIYGYDLKVDVVYPMEDHSIDVHVTTPHHVYSLTGVPTDYWRPLKLIPDSTIYSIWPQVIGVYHCSIYHDHHYNHHRVDQVVPIRWTLYVGEDEEDNGWGLYVKHVGDDQITVKAVEYDHILEIVPHGDTYQITMDGQVVDQEQYHEEWVHYHVFANEANRPVAVMLPQSGIHLEYYGRHVIVDIPKLAVRGRFHGRCIENRH